MPLSKESLDEAKRRLDALNKMDAERRTAELKNGLEGYIYSTKDQLESSEEFEKISTSDERKSVIEKLDEVQEWLYTDGEDAATNEFQEHLDSLKAIGDPLFFSYKELTARPAAADHARKYLSELQQIVQGWETNKPWLPKDKIYEVLKDADKLKTWLNEKETEQSKTLGFSKPVFTSADVFSKMFILQDKVASINRMPKPKPKVQKPKKSETETNAKNETGNSGESTGSSNSASGESPETGESTTGSDSSASENINKEPEVHESGIDYGGQFDGKDRGSFITAILSSRRIEVPRINACPG